MKYIIQLGIETKLGLFEIQDTLEEILKPLIRMGLVTNHIPVKQTQYEKIEDEEYELKGIINHSGGSFHISDKSKKPKRITEK